MCYVRGLFLFLFFGWGIWLDLCLKFPFLWKRVESKSGPPFWRVYFIIIILLFSRGEVNWREGLTLTRVKIRQSHTNRRNRGWTSADRSTRATLMLTVPRSLVKSSTEDLTWPTFCTSVKHRVDPKAIATPTPVKVNIVTASMDSDLEAFSHNPTDDSFAALAAQPTALPNIWTNGSSRTKLDYCRDNNSSVG